LWVQHAASYATRGFLYSVESWAWWVREASAIK
jgi:hypothetical protein